jgi:hypothetical protein
MPERLLWVSVSVLVVCLGVYLVRRRIEYPVLKENNEFAGFMYSMIGLVYGVYLAFTIIAVWEQFSDAEEVAVSEATHLSALWRDAQTLRSEDRSAIQQELLAYGDSVVHDEWPSMAREHGPSPKTGEIYEDLWRQYYAVQLDSANAVQVAFYQEMIGRLNDMGMLRRRRLLAANSELPPLMWILLLIGAGVTILFTFLFGTRHAWTQYLVVGAVTGLVAFSILLVDAMQYPYSGDVSIKPDPYESVVRSMKQRRVATVGAPQSTVQSR